ncbi:MAG: hypothetical protein MSA90_00710 [Faecalicatena sp.]|uniref:response regulator n=1 Tax=Faecalicatena sp. TaxID=2005360 RepID=UPI0025826D6A|nr:hypothetical protein [Faecalicatena sp.]MCI6463976.1 hypothetical protein [Faecalicatena sp.]MDY5619004.1 hypothetical protein [Lachnospiraceae bacterium]
MTANAFHEDVVKAYEAGMNGHIAKPVDIQQLYQTIERIPTHSRYFSDELVGSCACRYVKR